MERLQSMLRAYNITHEEDFLVAPWSKQYCEDTFPKYWELVYSILKPLNKDNRILEVGSGLGDITAILSCYPNFRIREVIPTSLLSQPKKRISCKTDFYMQLRLG